jgi:hypothetical protein
MPRHAGRNHEGVPLPHDGVSYAGGHPDREEAPMLQLERTVTRLIAPLCLVLCACDSDKPSMSEALAQADAKEAARKEAEAKKKAEIQVDKSDELELPWSFDALKAKLEMGTVLVYEVKGIDAKGKPVEDEYRCEIKATNPSDVGVVQHFESKRNDVTAKQVAMHDWSRLSPCFDVEKPTTEVVGRESVEAPAGSFETVVADLQGFFGARRTVYMIPDRPGVYAKVVDHPNANEENDQTELTYLLSQVTSR